MITITTFATSWTITKATCQQFQEMCVFNYINTCNIY